MRVIKFGGSSVGSIKALKAVQEIVRGKLKLEKGLVVIVSALQGITDSLLSTAKLAASGDLTFRDQFISIQSRHHQVIDELIEKEKQELKSKVDQELEDLKGIFEGIFLLKECSLRTLDLVASFGERLSARIVSYLMRSIDPRSEYLDARDVVVTDANFSNARLLKEQTYKKIATRLKDLDHLVVGTGFIGSSEDGLTTTLGRGGSDFTASIFGAALHAEEIEIWTDVDGVLTADPRKVREAFPLPQLTYREAMELSHFGAKVIYPPTMQPAMDLDIPLRIKNTFNPTSPGTLIAKSRPSFGHTVTRISSLSNVSLIRLEGSGMIGVAGISARLFSALAAKTISVILITQASSEHSICFAVQPSQTSEAAHAIKSEFSLEIAARLIDQPIIEGGFSIVAVVGEDMRNSPGVAGTMFRALGRNGINISAIAQGSSELNISAVINQRDESKAISALHDAFFLSKVKRAHVFILGTGGIGSTLLKQLSEHAPQLHKEDQIELVVIGVANSKKIAINESGLVPNQYATELANSPFENDLDTFVSKIIELNLPNSVLVDCTASDLPGNFYSRLMQHGVSIVTANKNAGAGDLTRYLTIEQAAKGAKSKFLYETTVGAGLPVIVTLKDLVASGDRIIKIEGALSGTLGFLCSRLAEGSSFSSAVKEAHKLGYTEPDPRDDLSGLDVARKAVILAREIGRKISTDEVKIQSLVPDSLRGIKSTEEFLEKLSEHDSEFNKRIEEAKKRGGILRYLAVLDQDGIRVGLEIVDNNSPFFTLAGTDNMIVFTSARYKERQLVVRGPGAGREVTAAGVFADIIRIAGAL